MIGDGPGKRPTAVVPQDDRPINFTIPQAAELRFPGPLLSLESVTYRYPAVGSSASNAATVLEDVTLSVHVGDRVGILGLNGAGKSTLIKVLVGELKPTKGTVTAHPRLKLGYYSQHAVEELRTLAASQTDGGTPMTALRLLAKECGGAMSEGNMRGLLGSFGLAGRTASDVPIAKLSGGQLVSNNSLPSVGSLKITAAVVHTDRRGGSARLDPNRVGPSSPPHTRRNQHPP